jgi:hypothetical protein
MIQTNNYKPCEYFMPQYLVLVSKDHNQQILNIRFPDFSNLTVTKEELTALNKTAATTDLKTEVATTPVKLYVPTYNEINRFVTDKINKRMIDLQKLARDIPEPNTLEDLSLKYSVGLYDSWMPVVATAPIENGLFARWLPKIGAFSAIAASIAGTVVSTVSLKLAMRSASNQNAVMGYSIGQATVNNVVGVIIYFYAKSGMGLTQLGKKIDRLFQRKATDVQIPIDETPEPTNRKLSTKIILTDLALTGVVLTNVVSNSVALLQQLDALAIQSRENDSIIPDELLMLSIWILISTGTVSGLSFVGSLVSQLSKDLEKHYRAQVPYTLQADLTEIAIIDDQKTISPLSSLSK